MLIYIPNSVPSSKNSRIRTRSGKFIVSKAVQNWRKATKEHWSDKRMSFVEQLTGMEQPYLVGFHFIRKDKRLYDWVNPLQTIQDEMVKHGWITDDNVSCLIPFPMLVNGTFSTVSKENAGVLMRVFRDPSEILIDYKYEF